MKERKQYGRTFAIRLEADADELHFMRMRTIRDFVKNLVWLEDAGARLASFPKFMETEPGGRGYADPLSRDRRMAWKAEFEA